ncbi:MAG TPA: hypothetical protein VNO70_14625, partial [Blastocatellia bacterium]|nr:hypothetical protein [Blastocatellia bacterium]
HGFEVGVVNEASMEPRSNERGNNSLPVAAGAQDMLQWSHVQMNVETVYSVNSMSKPFVARVARGQPPAALF